MGTTRESRYCFWKAATTPLDGRWKSRMAAVPPAGRAGAVGELAASVPSWAHP